MSRSHLFRTVQPSPLSAGTIASVLVCEAGTQTALAATMYDNEVNGNMLSNPIAITNGVLDFYIDAPQDVALVVTYGSITRVIDYQSVLPPAGEILFAPPDGSVGQIITLDNNGNLGWATSSASTVVDNHNGSATVTGGTSVDNGNGSATFGP